jgi:hypothetical protein
MWQHLGVPQDKEMKRLWVETCKEREYVLRKCLRRGCLRELLKHFALVDKITGEIHDINA